MADEDTDLEVAPEQGTQETPEQQAEREEREGQLKGDEQPGESSQSEDDQGEDAAAKRQKRVEKRIAQLTKQRHEALREAQSEREKRQELEKQLQGQAPADDPRPNFDDYDSVEKYQSDIESWARRQAQREAERQTDTPQEPVELQAARDKVENDIVSAYERYPDFDAVVRREDNPVTAELLQAVSETGRPADILYHLGKNPQQAQQVAQLKGTSLVREVARLESRLESGNGEDPNPSGTSAPDPIKPVQGKGARREPHPDELDIDTWMDRERERIAKQRR